LSEEPFDRLSKHPTGNAKLLLQSTTITEKDARSAFLHNALNGLNDLNCLKDFNHV